MKNKILLIVGILLLIATAGWVGFIYSNKKTDEFAKSQLDHLVTADFTTVYDNLDVASKNLYKSSDDFTEKFSNAVVFEDIEKTSLKSKDKSNGGLSYTYELVRKDDPLKGYTVVVSVSGSPLKNKIKDIIYQEEEFTQATQSE